MTTNARGILPPVLPLALSCSPSLPTTRKLTARADTVFAVGTELGPTDYDMYERGCMALPGRLIRLDIDQNRRCAAFRPIARWLATPLHLSIGCSLLCRR